MSATPSPPRVSRAAPYSLMIHWITHESLIEDEADAAAAKNLGPLD
jgi:hypothetical protein